MQDWCVGTGLRAAYNRTMIHSLLDSFQALVAPAALERLTLVINHVLAGETAATQRLMPHSGRLIRLELDGWPAPLPRPPLLRWRVTPAGLLEWTGVSETAPPEPEGAANLTLRLDASNPAALLMRGVMGSPPQVQIDGDAQLAGDVNWLMQNLRWDVAADLHRVFGPGIAQQVHQVGRALASGMRAAMNTAKDVSDRLRAWRA